MLDYRQKQAFYISLSSGNNPKPEPLIMSSIFDNDDDLIRSFDDVIQASGPSGRLLSETLAILNNSYPSSNGGSIEPRPKLSHGAGPLGYLVPVVGLIQRAIAQRIAKTLHDQERLRLTQKLINGEEAPPVSSWMDDLSRRVAHANRTVARRPKIEPDVDDDEPKLRLSKQEFEELVEKFSRDYVSRLKSKGLAPRKNNMAGGNLTSVPQTSKN